MIVITLNKYTVKVKVIFLFCLLGISCMLKAADKPIIKIETDCTSLIFQVGDNGRLYQRYLGKKLNHESDFVYLPQGTEVYITHGAEDYFEPAIQVLHNDGNPSLLLKYVEHSSSRQNDGSVETVITLKDDKYPVTVKLHYITYAAENIIKTFTEINHQEKKPIVLSKYASSMLHFNRDKYFLTEFSGDPAPGYCVSEVKVTPENISIAGDEETLAELNGELSLTDMISVEGVSESFTSDTINLADYLKENYKDKLKVKSGTASTLSVRVIMEKMGTKKIDIPLSAITIKGRPTDLDMVLTPADKITVEVAAVDGSLDNIDQNDVKAVLDLTSYQKEGRHEVPVQITLPNGYELTSEVKIVVNLTKKQKTSGSNTVISAAEE